MGSSRCLQRVASDELAARRRSLPRGTGRVGVDAALPQAAHLVRVRARARARARVRVRVRVRDRVRVRGER